MPRTAWQHFTEDMKRASALASSAQGLPTATPANVLVRDDTLRSAWMFAVGGLDAYFCDAYISLLTRTLSAKSLQASVKLPDFVRKIEIPVGAVLQSYKRENWRWRMAVRNMMDKDNVLQIQRIRSLFNPYFPEKVGKKLFSEVTGDWIVHKDATTRVFGITATSYAALAANQKPRAQKAAHEHFTKRFASVIQRRHDCIHNCDRPKNSPQPIGGVGTVRNVIRDVSFLVKRCNEHIDAEFPDFLDRIGCSGVTKNKLRV